MLGDLIAEVASVVLDLVGTLLSRRLTWLGIAALVLGATALLAAVLWLVGA